MQWEDDAIVLRGRRLGEHDLILKVITFEHGVFSGLLKAGASKKKAPLIQPGNLLNLTWRARLNQQLGQFQIELTTPFAAGLFHSEAGLQGLSSACALVELCFAERDPHPVLFAALLKLLRCISPGQRWIEDYIRYEITLLECAGFALQLDRCAVTGETEKLSHVSPKTGRAVCEEAAEPYKEKLLPLPGFLVSDKQAGPTDLVNGLKLSAYFLDRHILEPSDLNLPLARDMLFATIEASQTDLLSSETHGTKA